MNVDEPIGPTITHVFEYSREGEVIITLDKSESGQITLCEEEVRGLIVDWMRRADKGCLSSDERKAILKILLREK